MVLREGLYCYGAGLDLLLNVCGADIPTRCASWAMARRAAIANVAGMPETGLTCVAMVLYMVISSDIAMGG